MPRKIIPVIDIFAGPGGLSEGFWQFNGSSRGNVEFVSRLAIEKDPVAAQTLTLRSFFRKFGAQQAPEAYYSMLRKESPASALQNFPEWNSAVSEVWNAELGNLDESELHERIAKSIDGERDWILLGGPPCQAYSLMGRARMTGIGSVARKQSVGIAALRKKKLRIFEADHRHLLYREYLRIVAVHQPAVFVMENVKGILSAELPSTFSGHDKKVFAQIRTDLGDPSTALQDDSIVRQFLELRNERSHKYRLRSFVVSEAQLNRPLADKDFLIRAEDYGIPQKRHRVIILGIRDDVSGEPGILQAKRRSSVRDVLSKMPALRSGLSKGDSTDEVWRSAISRSMKAMRINLSLKPPRSSVGQAKLTRGSAYMPAAGSNGLSNSKLGRWLGDPRIRGLTLHESRSHMDSDLVRYLFASWKAKLSGKSPRLQDWPQQLLPAHHNISVHRTTGTISTSGFNDRFKVQVWDEPASTITSHIAKDGHYFIHPDPEQCRSLTVREAARIQTFPDNYFFCGNRTQQYQQIGNAVPPFLAMQLAEIAAGLFVENQDRDLTEHRNERRSQSRPKKL